MQESSTLLISRNGLPSFCSQQHCERAFQTKVKARRRSEEHTSELQSQSNLVCRLLLEKKKTARESSSHYSSFHPPRPRCFSLSPGSYIVASVPSSSRSATSIAFVLRCPIIAADTSASG